MNIDKMTKQGRLLYFSRAPDAISVAENSYFRWLSFQDVIQSVMCKRHTSRLTLPHQYAMMLPLAYLLPQKIVEFGLGGGNFARFINGLNHSQFPIEHNIVEFNELVIECCQNLFELSAEKLLIFANRCHILHEDASNYIVEQGVNNSSWVIYDIYKLPEQYEVVGVCQSMAKITDSNCQRILQQLDNNAWLTINIPSITEPELSLILTGLRPYLRHKQAKIFSIPRYKNMVIHFYPKSLCLAQSSGKLLPPFLQRRFEHWWQLGVDVK